MVLRVWLQEGHDGEPGVEAVAPEFLGFSTWAGSGTEVLDKLPRKVAEYCEWRSRHGLPVNIQSLDIEIVGRFIGNEIVLPPELEPAQMEDIDLTMDLLGCTRADLVAQFEAAPERVLDWDPPYERFAPWADWRTIRANLAHIANAETHYYTKNMGHVPSHRPADARGDWQTFLARSRGETIAFLEELKSSRDLCRVRNGDHGFGVESWSVRKALRRLVSHELLHSKSIRRIIHEYQVRIAAA